MTIFFIIMNLILTIIALLAIIILFLRQGKLFKLEDNQKKTIQEMEELLTSFVLEMKEDNEHLIKRMEEIRNEKSIFKHMDQKHLLPIELPINEKIEKEGKEKVLRSFQSHRKDCWKLCCSSLSTTIEKRKGRHSRPYKGK